MSSLSIAEAGVLTLMLAIVVLPMLCESPLISVWFVSRVLADVQHLTRPLAGRTSPRNASLDDIVFQFEQAVFGTRVVGGVMSVYLSVRVNQHFLSGL